MSAGMPELGSKISLISKADIRYEGRLFTVDPQECTIALANVRSFGTEDRETPYPIMPQPTVYDYILFRGSDIKDIRVVNNVAIPNDPAIMQMHLPPGQMPPQQGFSSQNFPPMQGQPGGAPMGQFGPFGGMQVGNMPPQQQQAQSPVQQDSRSGTPQNLSRKSPTSDMGVQTRGEAGGNKDKPQRNNQRNNNQQQQQRERRDSGRNEGQENKGGYRNQNQRPNNQMNNQQPHQQQQNRGGYNNRGDNRDNRNGGDNRDNRDNRNNGSNQNQMRGNQGGSARMRGPPMHMNNYRQQNNQGAPIQNNNQNKPNISGPQQQQQNPRPNTKQLKFENEFDFEQANSKFEELRTQLSKLKVGVTEEAKAPEQVNGEVEKKDDSGNETGADNPEVDVEDPGYDKNKSFFDNISCEAVERSKGKTQRTDWRQERKINSETFGYSFNRRGNFRGRGGYYQNQYNRGPRQGYRGGNPNYRPMRNHRNNADGRNPPQGGGSNGPQQSQNQSAPVAAN